MKSKISLFCLICFMAMVSVGNAQFYEFGFGLGKAVYWGDLNAPEFSTNIKNNGSLAVQILGRYNYRGMAGIKAGLMFGKISGDDKYSTLDWQRQRNLSFSSKVVEASVMAEYYIFGFSPESSDQIFTPYATIGVAAFYYNPTTEYMGRTVELQPLGTEGQGLPGFGSKYNKYNFGLPFGGGVIAKLNNQINVSFDVIGRKTFTDYIDDISTNYVSYDQLSSGNGQLSAILSDRTPEFLGTNEPSTKPTGEKRGGADVEDYYFTAMLSVTVSITDPDKVSRRKSNYRSSCPKF